MTCTRFLPCLFCYYVNLEINIIILRDSLMNIVVNGFIDNWVWISHGLGYNTNVTPLTNSYIHLLLQLYIIEFWVSDIYII